MPNYKYEYKCKTCSYTERFVEIQPTPYSSPIAPEDADDIYAEGETPCVGEHVMRRVWGVAGIHIK